MQTYTHCILKVKKCAPTCMIYGELGRIPMYIPISARMICFLERIINGKHEIHCTIFIQL